MICIASEMADLKFVTIDPNSDLRNILEICLVGSITCVVIAKINIVITLSVLLLNAPLFFLIHSCISLEIPIKDNDNGLENVGILVTLKTLRVKWGFWIEINC